MSTHGKVWLRIAEAFDTPPKQRTREQADLARSGLCWAYRRATHHHSFFLYRCWPQEWTADDSGYLAFTRCPDGDALRATFAGFFAAMTPAEWRAMLRSGGAE